MAVLGWCEKRGRAGRECRHTVASLCGRYYLIITMLCMVEFIRSNSYKCSCRLESGWFNLNTVNLNVTQSISILRDAVLNTTQSILEMQFWW